MVRWVLPTLEVDAPSWVQKVPSASSEWRVCCCKQGPGRLSGPSLVRTGVCPLWWYPCPGETHVPVVPACCCGLGRPRMLNGHSCPCLRGWQGHVCSGDSVQSRGQAVGDRPRPLYSLSRAPLEAAALLGDLVTPSISSALRYRSPITRPAPWSLSI